MNEYAYSQIVVLLAFVMVGATPAYGQDENGAVSSSVVQELVGTWELIAIIENGVDVTDDSGVGNDGLLERRAKGATVCQAAELGC